MQAYHFLCKELYVSEFEIISFISSAPKKYKIYSIPKRTSGTRIIAHPAKELKVYQRYLVKLLERYLKVHKSAYAYRKDISIKHNAIQHVNSNYLLKMDFQNFFNSITPELLFNVFDKHDVSLSRKEQYLLTQVLFWSPSKRANGKLVLSVGAPSSPFVSNALMYFFDDSINKLCKSKNITYTRYADDLTFSSNLKGILFDVPAIVRNLLAEQFNGKIVLNESKTVFSSKAHNRHVTGVTITNDDQLSIGRKRKRYISSLIHQYSLGNLEDGDIYHLQGLLAFANDIEPGFKMRMINKYSLDLIDDLMSK